jgi:hypothetical protein
MSCWPFGPTHSSLACVGLWTTFCIYQLSAICQTGIAISQQARVFMLIRASRWFASSGSPRERNLSGTRRCGYDSSRAQGSRWTSDVPNLIS